MKYDEARVKHHNFLDRSDSFPLLRDFKIFTAKTSSGSLPFPTYTQNQDVALTWVASGVAQAFPGLARKLPHYHKYSYLGFKGEEPVNILKGRWPVINSPLTVFVPIAKSTISRLLPREMR